MTTLKDEVFKSKHENCYLVRGNKKLVVVVDLLGWSPGERGDEQIFGWWEESPYTENPGIQIMFVD